MLATRTMLRIDVRLIYTSDGVPMARVPEAALIPLSVDTPAHRRSSTEFVTREGRGARLLPSFSSLTK